MISRAALAEELSCSDENILMIAEEDHLADDQDCTPGKFLFSSGEIVERLCVSSSCTKFGGNCPHHFDFPARPFSIQITCPLPSVSSYQFQTSGQKQLQIYIKNKTIFSDGQKIKPVKLWSDTLAG